MNGMQGHEWRADTHPADRINALEARVKELEGALVHIEEYWNRDCNEGAMFDACTHAVNTAFAALAKKEKP